MPTLPVPVFISLVLGYAFLRLWRAQGRLSLLGGLLLLCAAQALIIALAQHYGLGVARRLQPISAAMVAPLAWLAFLGSAVRPLRRADLWHALGPVAALVASVGAPALIDLGLPAIFIGYGVALWRRSLAGEAAQPHALLSHGNLGAGIWRAMGLALCASALSDALIILAQIGGVARLTPWIITVFSVGNLALIGVFSLSPSVRNAPLEALDPEPEAAEPDPELWARLTDYMARERPYLDPDLTLAQLARRLRVPAKTLSITINRATGENVSRYVNAARIAQAQGLMRQGRSITEAMFAAGFNTKSNFNRAFLLVAGVSPSDWLRAVSANPCS